MKCRAKGLSFVLCLATLLLSLVVAVGPAGASVDDSKCLECHDQIDAEAFSKSVHGKNACNSCHFDVVDLEEHQNCGSKTQQKVETCHRCHPVEGKEHFSSVHMLNDIKCADCHSDIHAVKKWDGNKKSVVDKCLGCHDGEAYLASIHGKAVEAGNNDSASCADCHNLHKVNEVGDPKTHAYREFHTEICHKCHANTAMMAKNKVPTISVKTYEESYHGKVESLGSALAAGCADCHTAHSVLPAADPKSSVNPANLAKTCGTCHKDSTIGFAQFLPHADHKDKKEYPVLYYTFIAMTSLLVGTFSVFWFHTLLWWRRAYWAQTEKLRSGHFELCEVQEPLRPYRRFTAFDRTLHVLMMLSFLGLVVTGLPLKFASAPWAPAVMHLLGGPHLAGFIHRICAGITFLYFGLCVGYVVYFLLFKPTGQGVLQKLFGPDSLFPNLRDLEDIKGMIAWFLGRGKEPHFDRWTYWEKFDFLAVFWGMFAIGGSGVMLWFPELFGRFLPGWVFNVAIIVHSDEALLASGFIFTVHFFNTHFRPGKFPMDMVIFTGTLPKQELCEERKDWCDRLEKAGVLDEYVAKPSHPLWDLGSQILGFTALSVGLICIGLVAWGFLAH
ncbi:MAG: cytochrome c3 family protein [Deltaproteobacteria bacterium]|nr:cytochrome c3 family protein [Deltaproteobacteria bacterium]